MSTQYWIEVVSKGISGSCCCAFPDPMKDEELIVPPTPHPRCREYYLRVVLSRTIWIEKPASCKIWLLGRPAHIWRQTSAFQWGIIMKGHLRCRPSMNWVEWVSLGGVSYINSLYPKQLPSPLFFMSWSPKAFLSKHFVHQPQVPDLLRIGMVCRSFLVWISIFKWEWFQCFTTKGQTEVGTWLVSFIWLKKFPYLSLVQNILKIIIDN